MATHNSPSQNKTVSNFTDFIADNVNVTTDIFFTDQLFQNQFVWTIVSVAVFALAAGLIGNMLLICLILSDKKSRNVTHAFLVSLAAADLILLSICAPLEIAHHLVDDWDSDGSLCKMAAYAETVSAFASVLNLLAVTLERFHVIVLPIRTRFLCTRTNNRAAVIGVWVLAFLLATPAIFSKELETYTFSESTMQVYSCSDARGWKASVVAIYRLVVQFIIPGLVMIVCYLWIIVELWKTTNTHLDEVETVSRNVSRSSSQSSISQVEVAAPGSTIKQARKQVIKMMLFVVVLFLLCWGPHLVTEVSVLCCLTESSDSAFSWRYVFYLMPFLHSCFNPYIYCLMSSKLQLQLWRCCCSREVVAEAPIPMRQPELRRRVPRSTLTSSYLSSRAGPAVAESVV